MTCEEFRKLVVKDEILASEMAALSRHNKTCQPCAQFVRQLSAGSDPKEKAAAAARVDEFMRKAQAKDPEIGGY